MGLIGSVRVPDRKRILLSGAFSYVYEFGREPLNMEWILKYLEGNHSWKVIVAVVSLASRETDRKKLGKT